MIAQNLRQSDILILSSMRNLSGWPTNTMHMMCPYIYVTLHLYTWFIPLARFPAIVIWMLHFNALVYFECLTSQSL